MAAAPPAQGTKTASKTPAPGTYFDVTGVTRYTEAPDNNDGLVTSLQIGSTVQTTNYVNLQQRDIITCLHLNLAYAITYSAGTGTLNQSNYFPYNLLGQTLIQITALYEAINLQSGIDLAIFNMIRPYRNQPLAQTGRVPAAAFQWPYSPETNLMTAGNYTTASTAMNTSFQLPLSIWFNEYFEVDDSAAILGRMYDVNVSPFYANGTSRLLTPQLTFNPLLASTTDLGAVTAFPVGTATVTGTPTATANWHRQGFYVSRSAAEVPPVFKWRYALISRRFPIGQQATFTLPVKQAINNGGGGQILSMFVRLFDPGTPASIGGAVSISNVLRAQIVYGSNSIAFDDLPQYNQMRFWDQHRIIPLKGLLIWDFALNDEGNITNQRALNTFTTDVTMILTFINSFTPTAGFYCVVGVEYLARVKESSVAAVGG